MNRESVCRNQQHARNPLTRNNGSIQRRAVRSVSETKGEHEGREALKEGGERSTYYSFLGIPVLEKTKPAIQRKENNYSAYQSIRLGRAQPTTRENANAPNNNGIREGSLSIMQLAKSGKTKKQKEQSKADRSAYNVNVYFHDWAGGKKRQGLITGEIMKLFLKVHPEGVRGHASGDSRQGKGGNTDKDFEIFKSWYTRTYEQL